MKATSSNARERTAPTPIRAAPATVEDVAVALLATKGEYRLCPDCHELAAFEDGGRLYCMTCTTVTIG